LKLPNIGRPESIIAIDLEGSYMSMDCGDLGSPMEGGKEGI
jgi:hypothetical protein